MAGTYERRIVKLSNIIAALQDNLAMKADPGYWEKKDWPGAKRRAESVDRDEFFFAKAYVELKYTENKCAASDDLYMHRILVEKLSSIMSEFYGVVLQGPSSVVLAQPKFDVLSSDDFNSMRLDPDWMMCEEKRAPFRRIFSISDVIKLSNSSPADSSGSMPMSDVIIHSMAKHVGVCSKIILSYDEGFQQLLPSDIERGVRYVGSIRKLLGGLVFTERNYLLRSKLILFGELKSFLDKTIAMNHGFSRLLEEHHSVEDKTGDDLSGMIFRAMEEHVGACKKIILSYNKDYELKPGSKSISSVGYIGRVRKLLDSLACAERDLPLPGGPMPFRLLMLDFNRTIAMKYGVTSLLEAYGDSDPGELKEPPSGLADKGPAFSHADLSYMMGTDEQAASLEKDVDPELKKWRVKGMSVGIGGLGRPEEVEHDGGGGAAAAR